MSFGKKKKEESVLDKHSIEINFDSRELPQNLWGSSKNKDCYNGLDLRIKKKSNQYSAKTEWIVQFRNRCNNKYILIMKLFHIRKEAI